MPAYAGAAMAAVMPGTTSNGTPAAASASHSSPPRPKTNGSPPLSRTTRLPARACATRTPLICSCVMEWDAARLPTYTISDPGQRANSRGLARAS